MWISKKRYKKIKKKIADLERQVQSQLFTIEMCRKIDSSASETIQEIKSQSSDGALSGKGSIL